VRSGQTGTWRSGLAAAGAVDPDGLLEALARWGREAPEDAAVLGATLAAGRYEELVDAFRGVLPFGTGGRRGRCGPGPHRINAVTVAASARGHARWLRRSVKSPSVVLAWDVRCFQDLDGRWLPASVSRVSSLDLARAAALAYLDEGVGVWWPDSGVFPFVATPVLSFAVRALGADGGLNVTASHNPPDDNGVKLYGPDGIQILPPEDEALLDCIAEVGLPAVSGRWEQADPRVRLFGAELLGDYHRSVAAACPNRLDGLRVVYSPLHGCGGQTVGRALHLAGASVVGVPEQEPPDGAFPGVPGRVANPELPVVYTAGIEVARGCGADLVLTTDPDADRLGAAVPEAAGWRVLDGDELAVLVLDELLRRGPPPDALVVCTAVTTPLLGRMARAAGLSVVDDLPVGFKFVCAEAARWAPAPLLLGAEESHGLLVTPGLGDKDAAGAALVLGSACLRLQAEGSSLARRLAELGDLHGAVRGARRSLTLEGAFGRTRLAELMRASVEQPPSALAGCPVVRVDRQDDPRSRLGPPRSATEAAARAMTIWTLAGGRICLRPSGTEPKLKLYAHAEGALDPDALIEEAVRWCGTA
jgi:phosphoglucomutase